MPFRSYDAAHHALGRAEALLKQANPKTKIGTTMLRADLRRLSLVMAVSALDTYMHRLVVERCYLHDRTKLPPELARLSVTFEDFLQQVERTADAARMNPHDLRPRVGAKKQLRERLLRETFQSVRGVSKALNMAGMKGGWNGIGEKMDPPMTSNAIKTRLTEVTRRRNQIVHEGDYLPRDRPRGPKRNPMSQNDARRDLKFIGDLIAAIHTVVSA